MDLAMLRWVLTVLWAVISITMVTDDCLRSNEI